MSVKRRKEQERFEKKFALYQQLQTITKREYTIEQGQALLSLSIPEIKRVIKLAQQQQEQLHA